MLRCEECYPLLATRRDLSPGQERALQSHLASCSACRARWQQQQRLSQALRDWPMPQRPAAEGITLAVDQRMPLTLQAGVPRRRPLRLLALAAVLVLLLLSPLLASAPWRAPELARSEDAGSTAGSGPDQPEGQLRRVSTADQQRPMAEWLPGTQHFQMFDEQLGWAHNWAKGRLGHTRDGGSTWRDVTPPGISLGQAATFVLDGTHAWVSVQELHDPAANPAPAEPVAIAIWRTADGGSTWAQAGRLTLPQGMATLVSMAKLQFVDQQHGWISVPLAIGGRVKRGLGLWATSDGGQSWELLFQTTENEQPAPGRPPFDCQNEPVFRDPSNGFLLGACTEQPPRLWATHDGGHTWQEQSLPRYGSEPCDCVFNDLRFFSAQDGYLLGSRKMIARSQDLLFYRTFDGGQSWEQLSLPGMLNMAPDFVDSNNGWLIAAELSSTSGPVLKQLYRTSDGGRSWQPLAADRRWDHFQIDFVSPSTGYALQLDPLQELQLLKTTDGGASWTEVLRLPPPSLPTPSLPTPVEPRTVPQTPMPVASGGSPEGFAPLVHMIDQTTGWAIVHNPWRVLRTSDGGASWRQVSYPELGAGTGRLQHFFLDANQAWIAGIEPSGPDADSAYQVIVWHTADGGGHWRRLGSVPTSHNLGVSVQFVDLQHGWLIDGMGTQTNMFHVVLWATSDGGQSWSRISVSSDDPQQATSSSLPFACQKQLRFRDRDTGWAFGGCGDAGVLFYVTRDGGRTWVDRSASLAQPETPGAEDCQCFLHALDVFSPEHAVLLGSHYTSDGQERHGLLYHSFDGGETWQLQELQGVEHIYSIEFVDDQYGWAIARLQGGTSSPSSSALYATSDGGATWELLERAPRWEELEVDFVDQQHGWAFFGGGTLKSTGLLQTSDGGETWQPLGPQELPHAKPSALPPEATATPESAPGGAAAPAVEQAGYGDPWRYCAAVGTVDAPDARYSGPRMPDELAAGLWRALGRDPEKLDESLASRTSPWRCMEQQVYACWGGANLPCYKANTSEEPLQGLVEWCKEHPNSSPPAFVTGRSTIYRWSCGQDGPVRGERVYEVDAQGFITRYWYEIPAP